jgi:hypothetical protein
VLAVERRSWRTRPTCGSIHRRRGCRHGSRCIASRLPAPGGVLTRAYKGRTVHVLVREHGFEYEGALYPSLKTKRAAHGGYVAVDRAGLLPLRSNVLPILSASANALNGSSRLCPFCN